VVIRHYCCIDRGDELSVKVPTPTLFIWGNHDEAVGRVAVDAQTEYITGPYREIELDAGHWLLTDSPEEVIEPVIRHLMTYK
jgi:pimeloyl-ACP methyl ester carboxylesterase